MAVRLIINVFFILMASLFITACVDEEAVGPVTGDACDSSIDTVICDDTGLLVLSCNAIALVWELKTDCGATEQTCYNGECFGETADKISSTDTVDTATADKDAAVSDTDTAATDAEGSITESDAITTENDAIQPESDAVQSETDTVQSESDTLKSEADLQPDKDTAIVDSKPDVDIDTYVNECAVNNGGCAQTCTNTSGGHTCSCTAGYTLNGDGKTCDDIDECTVNTNPCDNNGDTAATCANTAGSYTCTCTFGFSFTAGSCADVNECTADTDNCSQVCTNTTGGFTCSCNANYLLNADLHTCDICNTDALCGSTCAACSGGTLYCKDNGNNTSQCVACKEEAHCASITAAPHCLTTTNTCVQCRDNNDCNTGAGEMCNASHQCVLHVCPTALTLGTWASGDDGWSHDNNWWTRASGYMHVDYINGHNSNYTQNLTYATDIDLAGCTAATMKFAVQLGDDTYAAGTDKSEKLFVQCSGNSGGSWTTLTPNPWPSNQQSNCSSTGGYCAGGSGNNWSFGKTNQTISIPSGCLTTQARIQFQATGKTTWSLMNTGWYIYPVTIN